jgi:predicted transcriptional regulator
MAMSLRLTDEDDELLEALASAYGVSKQQAAIRAIREQAAQQSRLARVRALTADVQRDFADALKRLGEGPA